jgi:RNA polymerase sigma-70 factor (ECF subfamily)
MFKARDVLHATMRRDQSAPCQISRSRSWVASSETSDVSLIEAIAAGDTAAMQVLFARHNVQVYRFALRRLDNEVVAEDVVSDVFIDVWRQAGKFEGRSQVSTWLLAIARHKAIAIARRSSMTSLDDDAWDSIEDAADNPEAALQKRQQGSILLDCFTNLSPAHREIIDLVYYHQKSIDEVSAIIRVPRNTVKTRMLYARQKLAQLLDAQGITTAVA